MKITEKFRPGKTCFAFEILPPLKGGNIESIFGTIDALAPFSPSYVNVTYHREEVKLVERPDGLLERRVIRKRPGTVGIVSAIMARYGIDVVPHLICGGFSRYENEDTLIDLNFLGIDNVLALRGDNLRGERDFIPAREGYAHAADLVKQIRAMNGGKYLDSEIEQAAPADFCIGVAGYPEKHSEAPNLSSDVAHLKAKVDAGANYIVTQMFFDNARYFDFVDRCRVAGIGVPIVPGLKPFATRKQLSILPQTFNVDLPDDLVRAVGEAGSDDAVRQVGVEWAVMQGRELMKAGVPALHFYTMGRSENVARIARELF